MAGGGSSTTSSPRWATAYARDLLPRERAHICDFPDLYDYGGESRGTGRFSLMSSSSNQLNPVQVDAYLKNAAGWTSSITTLTAGMNVSLTAGQNDFAIYPRSSTEYFMFENRQQTRRDAACPDAGVCAWHVEEGGSNNNEQMTAAMHYELSLEQADGQNHLETNANSGDANDLFANVGGVAFSDSTTPNSRWWDGTASGLSIEQVSASGATMTFVVSGGVTQPAVSLTGVYDLLLDDRRRRRTGGGSADELRGKHSTVSGARPQGCAPS